MTRRISSARPRRAPHVILWLLAALARLAAPRTARGQAQAPKPLATVDGLASFYGTGLQGERTASGERLDARALVAAHPSWPFGTMVRVTNVENDRQVVVRVIDRGPAKAQQAEGVVIDVSVAAARRLGFTKDGRARVRLEVVRWGER